MAVTKQYNDGSQATILEVGDRVRIIETDETDPWWLCVGDTATVKGCSNSPTVATHVGIMTDYCITNYNNEPKYIERLRPWKVELI